MSALLCVNGVCAMENAGIKRNADKTSSGNFLNIIMIKLCVSVLAIKKVATEETVATFQK